MTERFPSITFALILQDDANGILLGRTWTNPDVCRWVIPAWPVHFLEPLMGPGFDQFCDQCGFVVQFQESVSVCEVINPPERHQIVIYNLGRVLKGKPMASDQISEYMFFQPDELGDLAIEDLTNHVLVKAGIIVGSILTEQAAMRKTQTKQGGK